MYVNIVVSLSLKNVFYYTHILTESRHFMAFLWHIQIASIATLVLWVMT